MGAAAVVACGFQYPGPGHRETVTAAVAELADGPVRKRMQSFLRAIESLTLSEWEEIHTNTLDLSPLFAPYVGHMAFGETYRRGELMANLKRAQTEAGVDSGGELPDHLVPVLLHLDATGGLHPDLTAVLPDAVKKMKKELKKADSDNPYRHLLDAVGEVVGEPGVETTGDGS
ncbi:nitrate reductase [bacterium]|nr:nitrate reductase [bacterium]